jgi:hypothetical protein
MQLRTHALPQLVLLLYSVLLVLHLFPSAQRTCKHYDRALRANQLHTHSMCCLPRPPALPTPVFAAVLQLGCSCAHMYWHCVYCLRCCYCTLYCLHCFTSHLLCPVQHSQLLFLHKCAMALRVLTLYIVLQHACTFILPALPPHLLCPVQYPLLLFSWNAAAHKVPSQRVSVPGPSIWPCVLLRTLPPATAQAVHTIQGSSTSDKCRHHVRLLATCPPSRSVYQGLPSGHVCCCAPCHLQQHRQYI